jgi:membrane protease subunit HflC
MKQAILIGAVVLVVLLLLVVGGAFYILDETQQVVITQFGDPVGEPKIEPGLKVKVPFIQKANFFEKRYLEWDGDPNQFPTKEKVYIHVDNYARWRISDPLRFLQRVQTVRQAQSRLDGILDGATRDTVARHKLIEVVRSSNREFESSEVGDAPAVEKIQYGREKLGQEVLEASAGPASELGIEILDVRFKRIKYREDVEAKVFERMMAERKRIAEQFRSEGAGEAARINGERERELKVITSEAYRQAQEIMGRADAEAAGIYASAYNRDPEFYRFVRSMEVLRETLGQDTVVLLGTDGELLHYLEQSK